MLEAQNWQADDILTLAEAASYLRVPEPELLRLAEAQDIPAQQIGGEWRFLKQALTEWLRYGRGSFGEFRKWPWVFSPLPVDELLSLLEKRLLDKLSAEQPGTQRGTKASVLKHFGIFKDDGDLEEVLASIQASRKAAGG